MPVVVVTPQLSNDRDVIDAWEKAMSGGLEAGMLASGEALVEFVLGLFETETDPWGAPWAPHSATTIKIRARMGKSGKILTLDRILAMSIAYSPAQVKADGGKRVAVFAGGAASKYAAVHQWGNPANKAWGRGPAPIPARPYFPMRGSAGNATADFPPDLREEIRATLYDAIKYVLSQSLPRTG